MSGLVLPLALFEQLLAQARAEAPRESCAILAGAHRRIVAAHPVRNIAEEPSRYLLEPAHQLTVLRAIRSSGHHVLALHHSHPVTLAWPSESDIQGAQEDLALTILSLARPGRPEIRGFRIRGRRISDISIRLA